jgi:hypothetical protein
MFKVMDGNMLGITDSTYSKTKNLHSQFSSSDDGSHRRSEIIGVNNTVSRTFWKVPYTIHHHTINIKTVAIYSDISRAYSIMTSVKRDSNNGWRSQSQ